MNGPVQADGDLPQDSSAAVVREIEIVNKKGLHARASAKFVQTAEQFDAAITVTRGHESVGGTSIMGLMMLAAGPGITITIQADRQRSGGGGGCAVRAHRLAFRRRGLNAAPTGSRPFTTPPLCYHACAPTAARMLRRSGAVGRASMFDKKVDEKKPARRR